MEQMTFTETQNNASSSMWCEGWSIEKSRRERKVRYKEGGNK
jgi:hypothetical protein